jgi:hypothetical protein
MGAVTPCGQYEPFGQATNTVADEQYEPAGALHATGAVAPAGQILLTGQVIAAAEPTGQ